MNTKFHFDDNQRLYKRDNRPWHTPMDWSRSQNSCSFLTEIEPDHSSTNTSPVITKNIETKQAIIDTKEKKSFSFSSFLPSWRFKDTSQLPLVLMQYIQLFLYLAITMAILYIMFSLLWTIYTDIEKAYQEQYQIHMGDITQCSKHYQENHCEKIQHSSPMLVQLCSTWNTCMKRNPDAQISRSKIIAHVFGEILNSFIEPIHFKTMLYCLIFCVLLLFCWNSIWTCIGRFNNPRYPQACLADTRQALINIPS